MAVPASSQKHTFTHPVLGELTGRVSSATPNVVHFRSVPFATIPARFRQSLLLDHIPSNSSRDFTEYGTACTAPIPHDMTEQTGGMLPGEEEKRYDEFSCLNLTIAAPLDALGDASKRLPVMVYVHGGAFMLGSGHISAWEVDPGNTILTDTSNLVDLSIREGQPLIIVSIHYRLHWLGFMACQDLVEEARSLGEAPGNYGWWDQRQGFAWIQRHIAGFGGDAHNLTAFGESAGSISIAVHMCCDVPLFRRAILMSGVPSTVPPIDLKYKELEYQELLKCCGINAEDPKRLEKLRGVPVDQLVQAIGQVGIPMFHGLNEAAFFSRGVPNYWTENELIANCEWVDSIMIGDCFWEGFVLEERLRAVSQNAFLQLSQSVLGAENSQKVLSAYEISSEVMDPSLFVNRMTYLAGDLIFSEPTFKLARSLGRQCGKTGKKIYRFNMCARNPFPGTSLHQIPGHHFVDLIYLFGTLTFRIAHPHQRALSIEMGRRWLRFGAGMIPWEEYSFASDDDRNAGKIMIISGAGGFQVRTQKQDQEQSKMAEEGPRRYAQWEAIGEVMNDMVSLEERGDAIDVLRGVNVRRAWGTDGGLFRLMGVTGPYGVVIE